MTGPRFDDPLVEPLDADAPGLDGSGVVDTDLAASDGIVPDVAASDLTMWHLTGLDAASPPVGVPDRVVPNEPNLATPDDGPDFDGSDQAQSAGEHDWAEIWAPAAVGPADEPAQVPFDEDDDKSSWTASAAPFVSTRSEESALAVDDGLIQAEYDDDDDDGTDGSTRIVSRIDARTLTPRAGARRQGRAIWAGRVGLGLVITGSVLTVLFLRLDLAFSGSTPTGGDNAGHVWLPSFLRRELLPSSQLTGWSDDWFAGFPVLRFYFPAPMWVITLLGLVIDPAVAYKLVTLLGPATIPLAGWFLGRRAGAVSTSAGAPVTGAITGLAMIPMLWDRHHQIYGGNLLSVFAGEFSFAIGLALALAFLGLVIDVAQHGRRRALASVVLGLTALCHLVPTFLAAGGAIVFGLAYLDRGAWRRRLGDLVLVGSIGTLLAAFWTIPFVARIDVTNSMDYQRNDHIFRSLWPVLAPTRPEGAEVFSIAVVLAVIGFAWAVIRGNRFALGLAGIGIAAAIAFSLIPEGHLWNNRMLPLWYLAVYVLAGFGVLGIGESISAWRRRGHKHSRRVGTPSGLGPTIAVGALTFMSIALPAGLVPSHTPVPSLDGWTPGVQWAGSTAGYGKPKAEGWAGYNYSGFEAKKGWPEYEALLDELKTLPCGRLAWEQDKEIKKAGKTTKADLYDSYGSSFAFMSIPYWTDGCIDTLSGIYFESSPTAPAQFLVGSYVSKEPSRSQRNLPYRTLDLARGVPALRNLGVRYYVAFTPEAKKAARLRADLTLVTSANRFEVYEVADHAVVTALEVEPVVLTNVGTSQTSGWNDAGIARLDRPTEFPVPFAADGPPGWQRAALGWQRSAGKPVYGATVKPLKGVSVRRLPPVTVFDVEQIDDTLRFRVDQVGRPVLVRMSWYPTWKASGALGPYRVDPNFMVVVPQSTDVRLFHSPGTPERSGQVLTVIGLISVIALTVADRRARGRGWLSR